MVLATVVSRHWWQVTFLRVCTQHDSWRTFWVNEETNGTTNEAYFVVSGDQERCLLLPCACHGLLRVQRDALGLRGARWERLGIDRTSR